MVIHNQIAQRQRLMRQQSRRRQQKQAQAQRLAFNECGRVTDTEDATTVNSGNITTFIADLDAAELDIATKASSTALSALDTRVVATENSITTHFVQRKPAQRVLTSTGDYAWSTKEHLVCAYACISCALSTLEP